MLVTRTIVCRYRRDTSTPPTDAPSPAWTLLVLVHGPRLRPRRRRRKRQPTHGASRFAGARYVSWGRHGAASARHHRHVREGIWRRPRIATRLSQFPRTLATIRGQGLAVRA